MPISDGCKEDGLESKPVVEIHDEQKGKVVDEAGSLQRQM